MLLVLAFLFVFLVGVLVGSGQVTRAQDGRDRRQAAFQRQLSEEWRLLQELRDEGDA